MARQSVGLAGLARAPDRPGALRRPQRLTNGAIAAARFIQDQERRGP